MAANKETVSFDAIIQAGNTSLEWILRAALLIVEDRQRRKNEALAQEILGRTRRASTPSNGVRKPGSGPSLASRIGISKVRSAFP